MKAALIAQLLPEYFRRSLDAGKQSENQLEAFLKVMEVSHTPTEAILDNLPAFFSPYQSPHSLLDFLQACVAFQNLPLESMSPAQKREMLAQAASLQRKKGTETGLMQILEIITGYKVEVMSVTEAMSTQDKLLEELVPKDREAVAIFHNLKVAYPQTVSYQPYHLHFMLPTSFDMDTIEPLHHIIHTYKPVHLSYSISQQSMWIPIER